MTPYEALTKARIAISRQGDMDRMTKDGQTKMVAKDGLSDTKAYAEAYNVLAEVQEQMKTAPGDWPWDFQP